MAVGVAGTDAEPVFRATHQALHEIFLFEAGVFVVPVVGVGRVGVPLHLKGTAADVLATPCRRDAGAPGPPFRVPRAATVSSPNRHTVVT
jgi:hypothetical protein